MKKTNNSNLEKTNTTTTGAPQFKQVSVNPNDVNLHQILIDMGYDNRPDAYYSETLKHFNHYEKPVIDLDNNALTHSADILAARDNGVTDMEAYRVNMTAIQLRKFIALKHKYNKRNLIASYNTIQFYEEYLTNDVEGIALADSLTGTTREKTARLMQTSDATIRRIKTVGEKKFDKLGLIQEREMSFKEVLWEIRQENMAANQLKKAAAATTEQPAGADATEDSYYQDNGVQPLIETPEEEYYEDGGENSTDDLPVPTDSAITTTPVYNFSKGVFTIDGMGELEVSVTDNVPVVVINGQALNNLSYLPITNKSDSGNGSVESFIITQPGKKGFSIQLSIENFPIAA